MRRYQEKGNACHLKNVSKLRIGLYCGDMTPRFGLQPSSSSLWHANLVSGSSELELDINNRRLYLDYPCLRHQFVEMARVIGLLAILGPPGPTP